MLQLQSCLEFGPVVLCPFLSYGLTVKQQNGRVERNPRAPYASEDQLVSLSLSSSKGKCGPPLGGGLQCLDHSTCWNILERVGT